MKPEELDSLRRIGMMLEDLVITGEVDTADINQAVIDLNCIIMNNGDAKATEDPMIYKFSDYQPWNNNGGPFPRGAA